MCGERGGDFGCSVCAREILGIKHGWIECKSMSFPGQIYYFNIKTRCSTWQRPVPRGTQLPQYRRFATMNFNRSSENEDTDLSSVYVSGSEESVFSLNSPPSAFELHARRMQIYLEKHSDHRLTEFYASGGSIREKLLECYRNAKNELAQQLHPKPKQRKPPRLKVPAKPKPIRLTKITRECNGIKTISYDPPPRELPAGARMPDLSETSFNSFMMPSVENFEERIDTGGKTVAGQGREASMSREKRGFDRLVFKDLNLSDSDTTASGFVFA